ncbi:MAG: cupin domain-containing protein [Candidatus Eremiobacteraeota bacterium]|nr:cupin domain-containing protein [Candidatus Eremiobacteraeota bacterium]
MRPVQPLSIPGIFMWSVWQPDRNVFFNSHFLEREGANIVVDPLAWTPQDEAQMRERGGVAWIVVTNRDHERRTRDLAALFGAKIAASERDAPLLTGPVDLILREGERQFVQHDAAHGEHFSGIWVVGLEGLKSPGEIALYLPAHKTAIVGDALWGDPAGSVRLLADDKLLDPIKAVLSLRKLWALKLDALLVGDGMSILHGADEVIGCYLESRRDVYVNRINIDDVPPETFTETSKKGTRFSGADREIGLYIGARKLGYRIATLQPGDRYCPVHMHTREEEMFFVWEGSATIRTPRGDVVCRRGDFICFPTGPQGAHQLANTSDAPCTVLLLGLADPDEVCYYPDSDKVMIDGLGSIVVRAKPELAYLDGE